MKPDKAAFLQSLGAELLSQASRVRQLIGDAHWGHDGRHKEVLLQEVIRRHCPSTALVASGFVVSAADPEVISSEQDLLVVDTSVEAPLFNEGGLVIAFPESVIAAVSIKSKLSNVSLKSVIQGLATVRKVASKSACSSHRIWCGGFFYSLGDVFLDASRLYAAIRKHVVENPAPKSLVDRGMPHILGPDVISDAADVCFIFDYARESEADVSRMRGYSCEGRATAIFVSCLLEHMTVRLGGGHSRFSDFVGELSVPRLAPESFWLTSPDSAQPRVRRKRK